MNSNEINAMIKHVNVKNFLGVFAVDQLNMITKKSEGLLVFNTDTSDKIGQHWISIHLSKERMIYYDSLSTEFYKSDYFKSLSMRLGKELIINKIQTQSELSDRCGIHCLVFCFIMSRGGTVERFKNFLKSFYPLKIGLREVLSLEYFDILVKDAKRH